MKKLQWAILGAVLIAISLSCISVGNNGVNINGQGDPVSLMTKSFDVSAIQNVQAITSGGNITIDGDASGQATIEVLGTGNNNRKYTKEEIMNILKRDYEFSVGREGNTLKAITRRTKSGNWKNAVNISYIIHVKREVATELKTSGGNIRLSNLKGVQDFGTSGGNIQFNGLSGQIQGKTSGGNILAVDSHGDIQARTSGGNIKMQNLNGSIDMRTSGGNISASKVIGRLSIGTSGGNIKLTDLDATVEGTTSGGSIDASFNKFQNEVALSTSGGSIRLNVPRAAKMNFELSGSSVGVGQANQLQVQINKAKDHATGTINGGGPMLSARTSGGSVKIAFN